MNSMNLLGIDFEEWYHPQIIQHYVETDNKSFKVVNGLDKILTFLNEHNTYATFFMVGELLESFPEVLDKILSNGHEIAFHTMKHSRLHDINYEILDQELKHYECLTNKKSKGFRAPTFSLDKNTSWAIKCLENNNYVYDSSIVPVKTSMYGVNKAEIKPYMITENSIDKNKSNGKILEFPLAITKILGKKIPSAGGFYMRVLPEKIIQNTIMNYQKQNLPAAFYIHSWELTPEYMPRIKMSRKDSFITYHNIENTMKKMGHLLKKFTFTSFEKYIAN